MVDPLSVQSDSSQFAFTNGIIPLGAAAVSNTVTITTNELMTDCSIYTVTVDTSVTSTFAVPLDPTAADADFVAADGANSSIVINEIDYHQVASPDPLEFIELYNPSATAFDLQDAEVALVNGSDVPPSVYATIALLPQVALCAGT